MIHKLIEHLRKLGRREIRPKDPSLGICYEIEELFLIEIPKEYFKSWEHYSGNKMFPVPYKDDPSFFVYDTQPCLWGGMMTMEINVAIYVYI